jgi:hypothetical protein
MGRIWQGHQQRAKQGRPGEELILPVGRSNLIRGEAFHYFIDAKFHTFSFSEQRKIKRRKKMIKMPMITKCKITECAYNTDMKCHALAITVGGSIPICDTFLKSSKKGGDKDANAGVGACKVEACKFNQEFECSAESVMVSMHADQAECDTFMQM